MNTPKGLFRQMQMNTVVLELLTRIMCDVRPVQQANAAYIYCQTRENQEGVLQTAYSLIKNSTAPKILVLNSGPKCGYPGFSSWNRKLIEKGVSDENIIGIEIPEEKNINTLTESEAFIRFAKKQELLSLIIVSPPFHLLRAYMTAATVAMKKYPELSLYSKPTAALSWREEVYHSQGTLRASRRELIHHELERILAYQKKGDLATYDEVLSFLNDREE